MEKRITLVTPKPPKVLKLERVAAYARVSSGKDAMLHSMSAQVSYYNELIQRNPEWQFAGVYADEAYTGTKDNREGFQHMLEDCRAGKIDMIITKSISRFARNTLTLLTTVRELKEIGVDVFFEEQNIHSVSGDGELMLTVLASFAQEESRSVSENCKWRIHQQFKEGKPYGWNLLYGFRITKGAISIHPEEAEVVRWVFESYLDGIGTAEIARQLRQNGVPGYRDGVWSPSRVISMLKNEKYCGNAMLQKVFVEDHLTKKKKRNTGELPRYFVEGYHKGIISPETFQLTQCLIEFNRLRNNIHYEVHDSSVFSGKIICSKCGKPYRRRTRRDVTAWNCGTYLTFGKSECHAKQIPEETLMSTAASVLGLQEFDPAVFSNQIEQIQVPCFNHLIFVFKDGHSVEQEWQDRSRRESWTVEMRQAAAKAAIRRKAI